MSSECRNKISFFSLFYTEEVQEKQETISGFIPFLSSDTYGEYLACFSLATNSVLSNLLYIGLRKRRPLTYEGVQMVTDAQEERDTLPDYTTSVVSFCELTLAISLVIIHLYFVV